MMVAQVDWTIIGVGLLTAVTGILGTLLGLMIQGRQASAAWQRERAERSRDERRTAYMTLLRHVDDVKSKVDGAKMVGSPVTLKSEATGAFTQAVAAAEFVAPAETWERMRPLVETVAAKANFMALLARRGGEPLPGLQEAVSKHGGDTVEGWDTLRDQYLAACRDDLDVER